jgi:hypothetical protein
MASRSADADGSDQPTQQTGTDVRQVPALARAMLRTVEHLSSHTDDLLSELEAELRRF